MAFYSVEYLRTAGFASLGERVLISEKASIYNAGKIHIKDNVRIDDFCIISAGEGGIYIGSNVHISCYASLIGKGKIEIGDFCAISGRSSIYSSNDDYSGNFLTNSTVPEEFKNVSHAPVHIGRHAMVGMGSCVLPGVTIGDGAAIGAFSLVNKDVEAGIIAVGVPAKKLKERSKKMFDLELEYNKLNF